MIRFFSWIAVLVLAPQLMAAEMASQLILECDKLFDRDAPYEQQIAKATEIRSIGIARKDNELIARGSIRMLLIEIHTGKWREGWKSLREEALESTARLGQRSVARIEVQAFDGYLRAMYFGEIKEGISDLRASIAAAISLELDALLTRAHFLLGRVAIYDEQELVSLESLRLSIQFARHADNEWAEFQALRQFFYFSDILGLDVESELRDRFRELCDQFDRQESVIMPVAERRAQMLARIEEFEELRTKTIDESLKEYKGCQEAARFLFWQFVAEDNWPEAERCLQIYEQIANLLDNESSRNECKFLRSGLHARNGNLTHAQESLEESQDKPKIKNHTYETAASLFWMAEQCSAGGDNQLAGSWYQLANETRDRDQITRASALSANAYFESLLSDRKLRGQIRRQEQKLLNQRWLLLSLTLVGLCIWLAQRTLQQRGRQKELQERIMEQTDSLRLAKEKAEAQNHAKTEYVARINHEIRNPLTAIVACSELIADAKTPRENRLAAQDTLRLSTENLLSLIDDVIDFSHIESGTLVACPNTFSPTELLDSVAAMIGPKLATDVKLRRNTSVNLPRLVVADETKTQQVLLNLAQNAVRHTTTGCVELGCQLMRAEAESETNCLQWTIHDTGSGMSQKQVDAVFTQSTNQLTGTGLGLYISKSLVDCMQGNIKCESETGQGTTFTVRIPFQNAATPEIMPEPPPANDTGVVRSVLVLDDEPANRSVLDKLLERIGCDCDVADTWAVAQSLLTTKTFDVVLLDLRMPNMDGFEVFRRLADLPIPYKPRVYAMTGDATETRRQQVAAAGFTGFLAKPFSMEDLSNIVNKNESSN